MHTVSIRKFIRGFTDIKSLVFGGFLLAGYFKADPRLAFVPIDLTLLLAITTMTLVVYRLIRYPRITANLAKVYALFFVFALPVLWTSWSEYPIEKVIKLFTVTLLSALAPLVLIHDEDDVRKFLNAIAAYGFVHAASGVYLLFTSDALLRLSALGSNTISLGRSSGLALLWTTLAWLRGKVPSWLALTGATVSGLALIGSGSRGPLLVCAVILLGLGLFNMRLKSKSSARSIALVLFLIVLAGWAFELAPEGSVSRIERLVLGEFGASEIQRVEAIECAVPAIESNPFGLGWGGFASQSCSGLLNYPHNLIVEVVLEAGWLAGIALIWIMYQACRRMWVQRGSWVATGVLVLTFFTLGNSLVSGDINDNRMLFALIGLSLGHFRQRMFINESLAGVEKNAVHCCEERVAGAKGLRLERGGYERVEPHRRL